MARDIIFADRAEAGRRLAAALARSGLARPVIYALPRGGVPVALEVARALGAPLEPILVRKIGAPGAPELALGAVVEGDPPETVFNAAVVRASGADAAWIEAARAEALAELRRRRARYLGDRPRAGVAGGAAVVVDDGVATGATMRAALIAVRRWGAARVVAATPVAPPEALPGIEALADEVVCLHRAARFPGVGGFYEDFHQLSDAETVALLRAGRSRAPRNGGG